MLESIFNETAAIRTAQHQICLIALPPDFQVGQARPLSIIKKVMKRKQKFLRLQVNNVSQHASSNISP